jgi:rhamnosyltransferase
LYITTDSSEKKTFIENKIKNDFVNSQYVELIITENTGRDVLPWLLISGRLQKYDVVGHFHTKKSVHTASWFGTLWQNELFQMLLGPLEKIMEVFSREPDIGIVIPDMPSCFHFIPPIFVGENPNKKILNELWKKIKCTKTINFEKLLTLIMPYGNMFWYRPAALKLLFDLNLSSGDFPGEPIPKDGTITHCIERIVTYISWNSGYDYRIVPNSNPSYNSFTDNTAVNRYLLLFFKSISYRMAKILFFLPHKIKKILILRQWK